MGGFGHAWADVNGDGRSPIAPYSGEINAYPEDDTYVRLHDNVVTQAWVDSVLAANPSLVAAWDDVGKCSYWHTAAPDQPVTFTAWNQSFHGGLLFHETPRSMGEKVAFANAKGMKGLMFWTLSQMKSAASSYPVLQAVR